MSKQDIQAHPCLKFQFKFLRKTSFVKSVKKFTLTWTLQIAHHYFCESILSAQLFGELEENMLEKGVLWSERVQLSIIFDYNLLNIIILAVNKTTNKTSR